MIESVIPAPVLQIVKAAFDGVRFHRGNPKTGKGLLAARLMIDKAENQLALAPGIAAVHHLGNVAAVQQLFQNGKLLSLAGSRGIFPMYAVSRRKSRSPA